MERLSEFLPPYEGSLEVKQVISYPVRPIRKDNKRWRRDTMNILIFCWDLSTRNIIIYTTWKYDIALLNMDSGIHATKYVKNNARARWY